MTLETCQRELKLAKTKAEVEFWKARIARKIATRPKYAHLRVKAVAEEPVKKEVKKKNGKKSKR